jgi:hypothetical protein
MDVRQPEIQTTTDFDLGATYMESTGRQPVPCRQPGDHLISLELINDDVTRNLMIAYASGNLMVNVKRFAACRAWIYRQAKAVKS